MKNIILGLIGLVWGGLILFNFFTAQPTPAGNASYESGKMAGVIFGGVLFLAGAYSLVRALTGKGKVEDNNKNEPPV